MGTGELANQIEDFLLYISCCDIEHVLANGYRVMASGRITVNVSVSCAAPPSKLSVADQAIFKVLRHDLFK